MRDDNSEQLQTASEPTPVDLMEAVVFLVSDLVEYCESEYPAGSPDRLGLLKFALQQMTEDPDKLEEHAWPIARLIARDQLVLRAREARIQNQAEES